MLNQSVLKKTFYSSLKYVMIPLGMFYVVWFYSNGEYGKMIADIVTLASLTSILIFKPFYKNVD